MDELTPEQTKVIKRMARYDVTKAQTKGSLLITGTKHGNIDVVYTGDDSFVVKNWNTGVILHTGTKKSTILFVFHAYTIAFE